YSIVEGVRSEKPFSFSYLDYEKVTRISDHFLVNSRYILGNSKGDNIPQNRIFYLGGQTNADMAIIPFLGTKFMKHATNNTHVFSLALQYEIENNKYLTLKGNIGEFSDRFDDIFSFKDPIYGLGLSFGTFTPLGPIEFTIMKNPKKGGSTLFFNFGYSFHGRK
ncbi:MAG: hypothetical protein PHR06_05935, partial [Candidatus Cloacimonetes bacterium]|nr:hypothetical protein [Candidatus Cloacimonadota bacterium]